METKKMPKNAKIFHCMACDFVCSKQSNYTKHLRTRKHKINGHFHEMELFGNKKNAENPIGLTLGGSYVSRYEGGYTGP